jgi:hypothetical protein
MCDRHRRHGANATPSIFQAPQRPAMHDTTSATARHRREVSEGPRSGSGRATASAVAGAATPENEKLSLRQRTRARTVINVNAEFMFFNKKIVAERGNDQRAQRRRARVACEVLRWRALCSRPRYTVRAPTPASPLTTLCDRARVGVYLHLTLDDVLSLTWLLDVQAPHLARGHYPCKLRSPRRSHPCFSV